MIGLYLKCSKNPLNGSLIDFIELYGFIKSLHKNTFLFLENISYDIIINFIKSRYINYDISNIIIIKNKNEVLSHTFNSFIFSGSKLVEDPFLINNIKSINKKHCIITTNLNNNINLFPNIKKDFIIHTESDKKL